MNVQELIYGTPNAIGTSLEDNLLRNKITSGSNAQMMHDIIKTDLSTGWSVDAKTYDKYARYGIPYNPRQAADGSLDRLLADKQSNWAKAGNALAQTIVSEIGLGTLKAFSDMFDAIGQATTASDHDYNNPVTAKLEEWQEAFRNEVAPIYSRPGSGFGTGTDFGWWMQNIPSVASSLTLLVPTNTVFGAIKGIGKAMSTGSKIASGTRKASKWWHNAERLASAEKAKGIRNLLSDSYLRETSKLFAETSGKALMMRTLENYQEARQTYDDMYSEIRDYLNNASEEEKQSFLQRNANFISEEGVDVNDNDAIARVVARRSADETFKIDYANTVFDVVQLYALRNIPFHGFRNVSTNAATRRLNNNAIKYANKDYKSLAELKQIISSRPTKQKIKEGIGDFLIGSRLAIGAQLSEGVEEAVNYIAQQEGMTVGHTMLGMESQYALSTRLKSYMSAPELWESAFWGLAGGITFQAAGSGLNRVSTAIEKYNDYKIRTADPKTKEKVEKPTWRSLWETADNKRDEAEMSARIQNQQDYLTKVRAIKRGNNPFDPEYKETDKDGNLTPEEQATFLAYANKQRVTNMVLDAMDSGRMRQLEAYLNSTEVRDAMKEQLGLTDAEAENIRQEGIRIFNQVQERYDTNVRRINKLATKIAPQIKMSYVPTEYIQLIARQNIDNSLQLEELQKQVDAINLTVRNEEANTNLDPSINYKAQVKLDLLTSTLGRLTAYKKELEGDKEKMKTVAGQQELARIEKRISSIKDSIAEIEPDNAIAHLLYAIQIAANTRYSNGEYSNDSNNITDEYAAIRQLVSDKNIDKLKKLDKRLMDITESDIHQTSVIEQNTRRTYNKKLGIKAINEDLFNEYANLAGLEQQIKDLRADMVVTSEDLAKEINNIHNWMNEARAEAILNAGKTFEDYVGKYGAEKLHQIVWNRVNSSNDFEGIEGIDDGDKKIISNALDILNLKTLNNIDLAEWLDNRIDNVVNALAAEVESSSASANPSSEAQNPEEDNYTETEQNADSGQKSGQYGDISGETEDETNNENQPISLTDDNGEYAVLIPNPNNEGTYFYRLNEEHPKSSSILSDDSIYARNGVAVSAPRDEFIIAEEPIVTYDNNEIELVEKGLLAPATQENINEVNSKSQPLPSTGGQEQTQNSTVNTSPIVNVNPPEHGNPLPEDKEDAEEEQGRIAGLIFDTIQERATKLLTANDPILTDEKIGLIRGKLVEKVCKGDVNSIWMQNIEAALQELKNEYEEIDLYKPIITAVKNARIIDGPKFNGNKNIYNEFYAAIDEIVDKHKTELGFESVNGKTYVNIANLLRYCNKVTNDVMKAKWLYNQLYEYMYNSPKYVIVDIVKNRISILNNALDLEPQNKISETDISSINFDGVVNEISDEDEKREILNIVDNIQIGQAIDFKFEHNNIYFSIDGKRIGRLYVPHKYKQGTDHLVQVNDGWVTDFSRDFTESELKDLFKRWADNPDNNPNITTLYDDVLEYSYADKKRRKELVDKIVKNPEFVKAKKDGFIDKNYSNAVVVEGLSKLWRYFKNAPNDVFGLNKPSRSASIDAWFEEKIKPSVTLVMELARREQGTVTISDITEGVRKLAIENETNIAFDDERLNKPVVGLSFRYTKGDKVDSSKVKIMSTEGKPGNGKVNHIDNTVSVSSNTYVSNLKAGSTHIVILNRNGQHEFVHAYAQRPNSVRLGEDARKIHTAIANEIDRILNNINSSDNMTSREEAVRELDKFMRKLVPNEKGTITTPLFCAIPRHEENGQSIYTEVRLSKPPTEDKAKRYLGFNFIVTKSGKPNTLRLRFDNTGVKAFVNDSNEPIRDLSVIRQSFMYTFDNDCRYNIGHEFIELDNGKSQGYTGVITRNNNTGKIEINIGDLHLEYDSYNDFVLNNIITVNLDTTEGGNNNFDRFPKDGRFKQTITVKAEEIPNSGVEPTPPVEKRDNTEAASLFITPDIITDALNTRNKIKGLALAKRILLNNLKRDILFSHFAQQIFPRDVIYIDKYIGELAATNDTKENTYLDNEHTDIIIKPGQTLIGKEWLDVVNSGELGRNEAVRLLIHEQLHQLLNKPENKKHIEDIRVIYDEFVAKNDDENLKKYYLTQFGDYITDGKLNDLGLEEFLVYSLTSSELAQKLNDIQTDELFKDKTKKSLMQRILEFLLDLFDWRDSDGKSIKAKIKDGSLYEKELKILGDAFIPRVSKPKITKVKDSGKPEISFEQQEPIRQETPIVKQTIDENEDEELEREINSDGLVDDYARISEVLPYSKEMLEIKQQAIADGTFGKIKNKEGKLVDSILFNTLGERAWLQVRTKAFKDWFGDWENDAANASKVVDENGEPLVVYHTTDIDFNIVDFNKIKSDVFFHSGSENAAIERSQRFGDKKIYKKVVFLNIKNPIETTDEQQDDKNLFLRFLKDNSIISDKLFNILKNSYDRNTVIKSIHDILSNKGIDGIKYINNIEDKGSISYGVINPNQIKSATDDTGLYSKQDNTIYSTQISSIDDFLNRFPLEDQVKIRETIDNGEISITCK